MIGRCKLFGSMVNPSEVRLVPSHWWQSVKGLSAARNNKSSSSSRMERQRTLAICRSFSWVARLGDKNRINRTDNEKMDSWRVDQSVNRWRGLRPRRLWTVWTVGQLLVIRRLIKNVVFPVKGLKLKLIAAVQGRSGLMQSLCNLSKVVYAKQHKYK